MVCRPRMGEPSSASATVGESTSALLTLEIPVGWSMIDRTGQVCRSGGWTLIKVANGPEDMRMDVPAIGMTTIEKLREARAACVVLEANKTIILEKTKVLELADRYKIAVVGYDPATMAQAQE